MALPFPHAAQAARRRGNSSGMLLQETCLPKRTLTTHCRASDPRAASPARGGHRGAQQWAALMGCRGRPRPLHTRQVEGLPTASGTVPWMAPPFPPTAQAAGRRGYAHTLGVAASDVGLGEAAAPARRTRGRSRGYTQLPPRRSKRRRALGGPAPPAHCASSGPKRRRPHPGCRGKRLEGRPRQAATTSYTSHFIFLLTEDFFFLEYLSADHGRLRRGSTTSSCKEGVCQPATHWPSAP